MALFNYFIGTKQVEKVVYCPLSGLQQEVYRLFRARVEQSKHDLSRDATTDMDTKTARGPYKKSLLNANNLLMQLRKLCNHPFLVLEDVQTIPDTLYYDRLVSASGKLFVLDKLLTKLLDQGSKVLIFSQMTAVLDILQGYLQGRGISCARLDGNTSHADRETQLREFNSSRNLNAGVLEDSACSDESAPTGADHSVFLLSTRAGGVGINLQAADTVILFDSDWNPQQDLQAISRAHRIGQTRPVLVLRLVSVGPDERTFSVEQRILRRATKKLNSERQVLANGLFDLSDQSESAILVTPEQRGRTLSPVTPEQESLLALFETITDTESVSTTDSSSPVPVSASSSILPELTLGHPQPRSRESAASVKPRDTLKSVVDLYQLDFTSSGVDGICERSDSTTLIGRPQKLNREDSELAALMKFTDREVWRDWLFSGDVGGDVEACPWGDSPPPPSSARKRGYMENSLWSKVKI